MLKNNKIIFTLCLIFFVLMIGSVCFGVSEPTIDDVDLSSYDGYSDKNYIICKNDFYYKIIVFPTEFSGKVYWSGSSLYSSTNATFLFLYESSGGSGEFDRLIRTSKWDASNLGVSVSSIDILNTNGSVFFQKTPQTIVGKSLAGVEMEKPITTTLVGLVKLLVPLLISLLGFWKAWTMLLHILRTA